MRTRVVVVLALLEVLVPAAAVLAATTGSSGPRTLSWAALGDSYASGHGNPPLDADAPCTRALADAYPVVAAGLLADDGIEVDLDFRACSGADVADLAEQADGVADDVDVVTITVGGNDVGFGRLVVGCLTTGAAPPLPGIEPCLVSESDLDERLDRLAGRLLDGVRGVLDHLPDDAVVLLVGYPDPLPTTGRCALLGGAETRRAALVVEGIDRVMAEVADQLDRVEYLSVVKAFADHHACADRPWIRGFDPEIRIPSMEVLAASYHPNPAGVAGYAGVLAPVLRTLAH